VLLNLEFARPETSFADPETIFIDSLRPGR